VSPVWFVTVKRPSASVFLRSLAFGKAVGSSLYEEDPTRTSSARPS
jgi:hypothetical protein